MIKTLLLTTALMSSLYASTYYDLELEDLNGMIEIACTSPLSNTLMKASQVTLERVSSAVTNDSSLLEESFKELKSFASPTKIIQNGDLIAVVINSEHGKWRSIAKQAFDFKTLTFTKRASQSVAFFKISKVQVEDSFAKNLCFIMDKVKKTSDMMNL